MALRIRFEGSCLTDFFKCCVELILEILEINKLLLFHVVGYLYYSPTLMMHGQTQIKLGTNTPEENTASTFRVDIKTS